jgi:hypothetical protein
MEFRQAFRLRDALEAGLAAFRQTPWVLLGAALVVVAVDGMGAAADGDSERKTEVIRIGRSTFSFTSPVDLPSLDLGPGARAVADLAFTHSFFALVSESRP